MILEVSALTQLAQQCAPAIAPVTMLAVAKAESGFDPWVVAVNGASPKAYHPASPAAAEALAKTLLAKGENLDLGLGQINSRNLEGLGLSVAGAFDPCRNLAASAQLIQSAYAGARSAATDDQSALRAALSRYNTGDDRRGLRNGYVARVTRAAETLVPALTTGSFLTTGPAEPQRHPSPPAPRSPAWDVFATVSATLVF